MTNREKVVRGLECCTSVDWTALRPTEEPCCEACPYAEKRGTSECIYGLLKDALSLLREERVRDEQRSDTIIGLWGGHCPRCDRHNSRRDGRDGHVTYCARCGAALRWQGGEAE